MVEYQTCLVIPFLLVKPKFGIEFHTPDSILQAKFTLSLFTDLNVAYVQCIFSSVAGTMQDYNYAYKGTFEIVLALSCCQFPRSDRLAVEWENNREALLTYIEQVCNKHTSMRRSRKFRRSGGVHVQKPMSR